jgi:Ran GTPase-activating protein (RanGAP) involved in mRNA processing and transport
MAALSSHDTLKCLSLSYVVLDVAELDALVDVALSHRMSSLDLISCDLRPDSVSTLSRLLLSGSLTELKLSWNSIFEDGVSADFCAALRGAQLSFLDLCCSELFASTEGGLAVLEALTGHPILLELGLNDRASPEAKLAFGEALGRLVSAESSLEALHVPHCGLGDDALRPLFAAVAQSTALRKLNCAGYNKISPEFARYVVLPAVRRNTSLRELKFVYRVEGISGIGEIAELVEAEALIYARRW